MKQDKTRAHTHARTNDARLVDNEVNERLARHLTIQPGEQGRPADAGPGWPPVSLANYNDKYA